MSTYNKLWGSIVGGVLGLLATKFALPAGLLDPAFADMLGGMIGSWVGTFFAPANAAAK